MTVTFLDIETTGLDQTNDKIVWVGTLDRNCMRLCRLEDVDAYGQVDFDTLVTYNGKKFDLPFLASVGVDCSFQRHVDLFDVAQEFWSSGRLISKDSFCREVGIYIPKDAAGSGKHVALINRRTLEGSARDSEIRLVKEHLANDLFATAKLFDFCVAQGWVVI